MNLDPLDSYTDAQIWQALEHAHLKSYVNSVPSQLDYECGEGGQNLRSVGTMICHNFCLILCVCGIFTISVTYIQC